MAHLTVGRGPTLQTQHVPRKPGTKLGSDQNDQKSLSPTY